MTPDPREPTEREPQTAELEHLSTQLVLRAGHLPSCGEGAEFPWDCTCDYSGFMDEMGRLLARRAPLADRERVETLQEALLAIATRYDERGLDEPCEATGLANAIEYGRLLATPAAQPEREPLEESTCTLCWIRTPAGFLPAHKPSCPRLAVAPPTPPAPRESKERMARAIGDVLGSPEHVEADRVLGRAIANERARLSGTTNPETPEPLVALVVEALGYLDAIGRHSSKVRGLTDRLRRALPDGAEPSCDCDDPDGAYCRNTTGHYSCGDGR